MRRSKFSSTPRKRPQLAFEPLETRELLAADAGVAWWSDSWVETPDEDWSWSYDDFWASDTGLDDAWDDGWWVDDVSWASTDDFGSDPVPFGDDIVTSDWLAEVVGDAGWDVGLPDEMPVTAADEQAFSPPPADASTADTDPSFDDLEPIVIEITSEVTDDVVADLVHCSGEVREAEVAIVDIAMPVGDADTGADAVGMPEESRVLDAFPPESPTVEIGPEADEPDLVFSDDPVVVTVVRPTPAPDAPPTQVATMSLATPAATTTQARDRFAGWGAFLFESSRRPAGFADAAAPSGAQPGTGRPRIRLPFRPFV